MGLDPANATDPTGLQASHNYFGSTARGQQSGVARSINIPRYIEFLAHSNGTSRTASDWQDGTGRGGVTAVPNAAIADYIFGNAGSKGGYDGMGAKTDIFVGICNFGRTGSDSPAAALSSDVRVGSVLAGDGYVQYSARPDGSGILFVTEEVAGTSERSTFREFRNGEETGRTADFIIFDRDETTIIWKEQGK